MREVHVDRYRRARPGTGVFPLPPERVSKRTLPMFPKLPRKSEIPPVPAEMLRRLYLTDAAGMEDRELLEEVESRLIVRGETWLDLNRWYLEVVRQYGLGFYTDDQLEGAREKALDKIADYGMWDVSYTGYKEVERAIDKLKVDRGESYKRRMMNIDALVHVVHDRGPLATIFIDVPFDVYYASAEPEKAIQDFLDELAGK